MRPARSRSRAADGRPRSVKLHAACQLKSRPAIAAPASAHSRGTTCATSCSATRSRRGSTASSRARRAIRATGTSTSCASSAVPRSTRRSSCRSPSGRSAACAHLRIDFDDAADGQRFRERARSARLACDAARDHAPRGRRSARRRRPDRGGRLRRHDAASGRVARRGLPGTGRGGPPGACARGGREARGARARSARRRAAGRLRPDRSARRRRGDRPGLHAAGPPRARAWHGA